MDTDGKIVRLLTATQERKRRIDGTVTMEDVVRLVDIIDELSHRVEMNNKILKRLLKELAGRRK